MKLFFTDLDGTLLNKNGQIGEKTREALDKWVRAGHRFILSSGRPLDSILEVKEQAKLNYPNMLIIASNGSIIYDCDSQSALKRISLPFSDVAHVLKVAKELSVHCQTYTDTHIVCEKENEHLTFYTDRIHLPCIITEDVIGALDKEPLKLLAIDIHSHKKLVALEEALASFAPGKIEMLYSRDELLEIIPYNSGKGNALRSVCELLNVPIENSYAAGDMNNDFTMLEAAGTSIAMKNATPLLKEMASVITPYDNDNDGLVPILEKIM